MARPSVIPGIKARLELWLDEREAAYLAQPDAARQPTLPVTPDGKVNVRALAQAIDLKFTQEKYLYEREELTSLINRIAEGQGVLTIGARVNPAEADKQIKRKIYTDRAQARSDVFDYIELFYNPRRRHGFTNQLSPVEFERQYFLKNGTV